MDRLSILKISYAKRISDWRHDVDKWKLCGGAMMISIEQKRQRGDQGPNLMASGGYDELLC
jgi:hypothetical protein